MTKSLSKLGLMALLAGAVALWPAQGFGQADTKATPEKKATTGKKDASAENAVKQEKKKSGHPFHGKLAAVDKVTKTIKLGKSTYQVTSETRIRKSGQPATLDDAVVGEEVGGYVRPNAEGKMTLTTLNLGPRTESKGEAKGETKGKTKATGKQKGNEQ